MQREINLQESYDTPLTPKDRNAIIRYCISIGTMARCSTTRLLRPFKQKYLVSALHELKSNQQDRIAKIEEQICLYNMDQLCLSDWLIEFFGGKPTKKQFEEHMREQIIQERKMVKSFSKCYTICVDFEHISKELLAFHNSLNPHVTFGYSSMLHEECNFELTKENKRAFLNSSLKDLPAWEKDWSHDWGYVFFGRHIDLCYEDLIIFRGDRCILDTISHEHMMTLYLSDEEIENFALFEENDKNLATIEKLKDIIKRQKN